jgi:hypothetical protein
MLRDNPLLTFLGRRGRGAVVDALRMNPEKTWTVRELARIADVPAITASRAVKELDALGVVDAFRPGRNKHIRWETESAVAQALVPFVVPDLRGEAAVRFAAAFMGPTGARPVSWHLIGDDIADPNCPTRVAILLRSYDDEDDALDAIGPALDVVAESGWPRPSVTTIVKSELGDDEVAQAIRAGRPL